MTRIACQTPQMAVTWENQKGRHFVLLTERRSICSPKLRENNSFFLWKMEDSDTQSCLMEGWEMGGLRGGMRAVKVKADTSLFLFDFLNEKSSLKRGKISL